MSEQTKTKDRAEDQNEGFDQGKKGSGRRAMSEAERDVWSSPGRQFNTRMQPIHAFFSLQPLTLS